MKRRSRVIVRGHRQSGTVSDQISRTPRVRKAIEFFANELRTAVGEAVFERIRDGRWHTSRDDRYRYFRTWSKYRYGSSRARTRMGARFGRDRKTRRVDDPDYKLPHSPDVVNTVDLLKFNFLSRALRKQALVMDNGSLVVGPRKALAKHGQSPISELADAYDVTSAIDKIAEIYAQYGAMRNSRDQSTRQQAKSYLNRQVQAFLHGEYDYNRFFMETKLGQKYLRSAELAAMRHSRNEMVLDPQSGFYDQTTLTDAEKKTLNRRQINYKKIRKDILHRKQRVPTFLAAGSMSWGWETGTLAKSWQRAKDRVLRRGRRFRIVISPPNKRDGRNPSPLMLTEYLKRNIRKQGGTPSLLGRNEARKVAREALQKVRGEWASMGIRVRGGFTKGGR